MNTFLKRQAGASAVEFAISVGFFVTMMLVLMELGRVLYYWSTAVEATRLGARVGAVCDMNAAAIKTKMNDLLPILPTSAISVTYLQKDGSTACADINECSYITVAIDANTVAIQTYVPYMPWNSSFYLPAFSTTLPRESLQSTFNGTSNTLCN